MNTPKPVKQPCSKSREEYEATAMLLGYEYDMNTHTFVDYKKIIPESGEFFDAPYEYDADTLEPVMPDEVGRRIENNLKERDGTIVHEDDFDVKE